MRKLNRKWSPEDMCLFAATCFHGVAQVIQASGKPLLAIALMVAILTGQPTKLLQLLASVW